jgi:integrase/recombinase XerC
VSDIKLRVKRIVIQPSNVCGLLLHIREMGERFAIIKAKALTFPSSFDIISSRWNNMKTEINHFLDTFDRSPKTIFAYRNSLAQFVKVVGEDAELNTETYVKFLISLKHKSPSTQRVYRTAVLKFYAFRKAGNWAELKEATEHYTRNPGKRIVNFNREALEQVITHCKSLRGDLFALRDRAFVLTLVDTGLRISEACSLKRGDIDWQECRAIIIGKGDKQAVIRFSNRSIQALKDYLHERAKVDPNSRKPLTSQPLFARHDITASKTIKPISSGGMWKAIKDRMTEAGVDRHLVRIHDFRHYFVTMTYLAKGNLKLSQELARHESISTTNRYAHFGGEADIAYDEIFNKEEEYGEN